MTVQRHKRGDPRRSRSGEADDTYGGGPAGDAWGRARCRPPSGGAPSAAAASAVWRDAPATVNAAARSQRHGCVWPPRSRPRTLVASSAAAPPPRPRGRGTPSFPLGRGTPATATGAGAPPSTGIVAGPSGGDETPAAARPVGAYRRRAHTTGGGRRSGGERPAWQRQPPPPLDAGRAPPFRARTVGRPPHRVRAWGRGGMGGARRPWKRVPQRDGTTRGSRPLRAPAGRSSPASSAVGADSGLAALGARHGAAKDTNAAAAQRPLPPASLTSGRAPRPPIRGCGKGGGRSSRRGVPPPHPRPLSSQVTLQHVKPLPPATPA